MSDFIIGICMCTAGVALFALFAITMSLFSSWIIIEWEDFRDMQNRLEALSASWGPEAPPDDWRPEVTGKEAGE
jgi:hypothetical protein